MAAARWVRAPLLDPMNDGRVAAMRILLGQPAGDRAKIDIAQPGRVHPLGGTDPGVDLAEQRPGQVARRADGPAVDRRAAQMGEGFSAQGGGEGGDHGGGGVEQGDRVGRLQIGHRGRVLGSS